MSYKRYQNVAAVWERIYVTSMIYSVTKYKARKHLGTVVDG